MFDGCNILGNDCCGPCNENTAMACADGYMSNETDTYVYYRQCGASLQCYPTGDWANMEERWIAQAKKTSAFDICRYIKCRQLCDHDPCDPHDHRDHRDHPDKLYICDLTEEIDLGSPQSKCEDFADGAEGTLGSRRWASARWLLVAVNIT